MKKDSNQNIIAKSISFAFLPKMGWVIVRNETDKLVTVGMRAVIFMIL